MKNKIVVITGAGSGIGRALALEFGKLGATLALNDSIETDLEETVAMLRTAGTSSVLSSVFDVVNKKAMADFAKRVKSEINNANIVINNAGVSGVDLPAYLIKEENYRRVMDVNFFGVLNGCQAFLPQLVENNSGSLVNISSVFGMMGVANCSDYCASKFAVRGYTEALATEFQDSPINIHCVHPGGINTRIKRNGNSPDYVRKYLRTPAQDIAKHIIKSIQKNKVKIVYGANSNRAWFLANLVPQKLANKLIWDETKKTIDLSKYESFIKSL